MKSLVQYLSQRKHYMSPLLLFLTQLVLAQSYEMDATIIPFHLCFLKVKSLGWRNDMSSLNTILVRLSLRWPPFSGHRVGYNINWSPQKYSLLILNFRWLWELLEFNHIAPWRRWPESLVHILVSVISEIGPWVFILILELPHTFPIYFIVSIWSCIAFC